MQVGLTAYAERYPDADVVLFEPQRDEFGMFFANLFSFAQRLEVCDLAYRATRADLRTRRRALGPILARHGVSLRTAVLDDETRTLWRWAGLEPPTRPMPSATGAWRRASDALDLAIARLDVTRASRPSP
jgi:hypothetical protein